MITKFDYTSTATRKVKPTIVNLSITVNADAVRAKDAIYQCAEYSKQITDTVTKMSSYIENSYIQSDFRVIKLFKQETSNEPNDRCHTITTEVFDKYNASLQIYASFTNSEQLITDISNLLKLLDQYNFKYVYECTLSDSQLNTLYNELYSEAINIGLKNITQIIAHTTLPIIYDPVITITHISDSNSYRSFQCGSRKYTDDSDRLIPEMLSLTFNSYITFTKTVDLVAEIDFCRN